MKWVSVDEQEAFRRMQKLASEKSRKLVDIAQMIVVAEEAVNRRHGNGRKERTCSIGRKPAYQG